MHRFGVLSVLALLTLLAGCSFSPRYGDSYEKCRPAGECPDGCTCLGGDICVPDDSTQDPAVCSWCSDTQTNCNGECVDTDTDKDNCGGCGNSCTALNGTAKCDGGKCAIASCTPPYANCDGSFDTGCKTDTDTDKDNCGGCGKPCFFEHAKAICDGGACQMDACEPGFADCNDDSADGCETPLGTLDNCKACLDSCDVFPLPVCLSDGSLKTPTGDASCDGECRYQTRVDDCGPLGCLNDHCLKAVCPNSDRCPPGQWCNAENVCLCGRPGQVCNNGDCCDGTCTNLQNDTQNCGFCGRLCQLNEHCEAGDCVCDDGFADCSADPGCETDVSNDQTNCGICYFSCPNNSYCENGTCYCSNAFIPCADPDNGSLYCADSMNDNDNCGDCGVKCVSGASCNNEICTISGFLCNGTCEGAGATCCDYGQGLVCTTEYCPGPTVMYCNDPGDCNPGDVCCLTQVSDSAFLGKCEPSCMISHIVCTSDFQCADIDPIFHCCQETINDAGTNYNFNHCCYD